MDDGGRIRGWVEGKSGGEGRRGRGVKRDCRARMPEELWRIKTRPQIKIFIIIIGSVTPL